MSMEERMRVTELARAHWPGIIVNNVSAAAYQDAQALLHHSQQPMTGLQVHFNLHSLLSGLQARPALHVKKTGQPAPFRMHKDIVTVWCFHETNLLSAMVKFQELFVLLSSRVQQTCAYSFQRCPCLKMACPCLGAGLCF